MECKSRWFDDFEIDADTINPKLKLPTYNVQYEDLVRILL